MSGNEGGAGGLEEYCILSRSSKGRASVALIKQVLGAKNIFVFGELLDTPNVQALRGTEHEPWLRLLEVFAYKTLMEYEAEKKSLPPLSPAYAQKLRMLSIISVSQRMQVVPYSLLLEQLRLESIRQLEDIIIDTIYAGLIQGKLNQMDGALKVKYAVARDVRVEEVGDLLTKLTTWETTVQGMLSTLGEAATIAADKRVAGENRRKSVDEKKKQVRKGLKDSRMMDDGMTGEYGGYDDEDMDSDRPRRLGRGKRIRGFEGRHRR